jgi:hypothetical protein
VVPGGLRIAARDRPGTVFGLLSLAFAIGVVLAGRERGLRVTGWLLVAVGVNHPTPWVGDTERICIGAYLLWMIALSGALLWTPASSQTNSSARTDARPSATPVQRTPASSEW